MRDAIVQLEALRRRGWLMLLFQRAAIMLAWVIGITVVLILLDFALRLPSGVRAVLLAAGLATLVVATWRYVIPAARFRPTLTQLALRVERALPPLAGRLASSVEFAMSGVDQENALAARSVRDTQTRLIGESMARIIAPRTTIRDMAIMLALALVAAFFVLNHPAGAQTGLARLFVPFGDAKWPARTGVESLMAEVVRPVRADSADADGVLGVHPRGQALPLRARVTRGDAAQRVEARYRLGSGTWQHVVLTQQGSSAVHERLIDVSGVSGADEVEVLFSTQDDQTSLERITIATPPAVRRASLTVTPPEYAAGFVPPFEAELGPGTDSRAQTDIASIIGSHVRLDLHLNKAVPVAPGARTESALTEWLRSTLDWDDESELPEFAVDNDQPARWSLEWTLDRTRALQLHLVDEYGLTSAESIAYRIDAVADAPPSVAVIQPQADEAVLATALVPLAVEAQDDVGIAHLAIDAHLARIDEGESDEPALWSAEKQPQQRASATLAADLDLAQLSLREGDVVYVTGLARDVYMVEGEARQMKRSPPRRLRIISELELEAQIRRELGSVRQNAIRMESQQAELQEALAEIGLDAAAERAQAQISERIAAQRETISELGRQLESNRMREPHLDSLLQQSADLLDFAGRASNEAASTMAQQRERGHTDDREREIAEQQQEVRAELSDLIELLDRDEDAWVVTRQLEGLMSDQAQLQEDAAMLGERTMGRPLGELTPEEVTELDRIAQRQRELRDRARELTESLRSRAEQLQEVDPQTAAGMRDAARTSEERELDRDMDRAAEQAEQNQMRNAGQSQQAANETMQRMLEDIQQTQRARAEELMRELASLVQSIERLIVVQENELIALANARHRENFSGRDTAMIRLNQNTQAVAGEARAIGQQARRIARTLDRAVDAQGTAISALRARPIQVDDAEDAESRSLELLKEAKALAEELEQQTRDEEAQRRREELLDAYRAFAERQVVLREQTLELQAAGRLDRRQLVEARRLGSQQDQIRLGLLDLQHATREVMDSPVFSHVHARINDWARQVSDRLEEGDVDSRVTDRQALIAESIGRLVQALEEQPPTPQEFDQGEGGADAGGEAGGGGSAGLIPPLAELRLLRGVQEQVYNQTREIGSRTDLDEADRRERLLDVGTQQRELIEISRQLLETLEQAAPSEPVSPQSPE